jgi:hypothetical protein
MFERMLTSIENQPTRGKLLLQKWEYMFVEQEGGTEGGTLYRVNGELLEHKEVWTFANEMGRRRLGNGGRNCTPKGQPLHDDIQTSQSLKDINARTRN